MNSKHWIWQIITFAKCLRHQSDSVGNKSILELPRSVQIFSSSQWIQWKTVSDEHLIAILLRCAANINWSCGVGGRGASRTRQVETSRLARFDREKNSFALPHGTCVRRFGLRLQFINSNSFRLIFMLHHVLYIVVFTRRVHPCIRGIKWWLSTAIAHAPAPYTHTRTHRTRCLLIVSLFFIGFLVSAVVRRKSYSIICLVYYDYYSLVISCLLLLMLCLLSYIYDFVRIHLCRYIVDL